MAPSDDAAPPRRPFFYRGYGEPVVSKYRRTPITNPATSAPRRPISPP